MSAKLHATLAAAALLSMFGAPAFADEDCTKEPQEKWISKDDMKAKIDAAGYKDYTDILVSGTCYEIYANNKDGKMVEVYFNPTDGSIFKEEVEDDNDKAGDNKAGDDGDKSGDSGDAGGDDSKHDGHD